MKQLYKHEHEGVRFSKNGHLAYLRGEKPKWMWPKGELIEPTVAHHLEFGSERDQNIQRPLVMFYRLKVESPNHFYPFIAETVYK